MDEHVDAASATNVPSEPEKKVAEQNLQSLGSEFAVAQEWGLFSASAEGLENEQAKAILDYIKSAAAAIAANNLAGANDSTLAGRAILNRVQVASRYWFVANNRFGFLPLAMTGISGLLAYWVILRWFLSLDVPRMLHHPIFFGWVGAILKSLYWLQFQINKGLLRPRWFTYFMIAPVVGVILGGIAALVVNVGFRIAGGNTSADWKTVALFAAFAGFNWEWALEKFRIGADAVSSRIFAKK